MHRSPLALAVLLLLSSFVAPALAQSSSSSSFVAGPRTTEATSTAPSSSAAATTPLAVPSLIFVPISPVTACGSARINWQLYNEDPAEFEITLSVLNLGVDQSIPISTSTPSSTASSAAATSSAAPSSSSSSTAIAASGPIFTFTQAATQAATSSAAASSSTGIGFQIPRRSLDRRTDLQINATVVAQNANVGFTWDPIGLPEGRYFLIGNVNDPYNTSGVSTIFTVLNGTDMDCLASSNLTDGAFAPSNSSTTTSQSVSPSATLAAASNGSSSGGGIGTGGIVGLVVGIIVGMGLVGVIVWCCIRRKRRAAPGADNMEERKSGFAWPSTRMSSERSSHPGSAEEGGPTIATPQAGVVSRPIDGRSIRSSRPDSIGLMSPHRGSDESFHTPEMGSNPFMTPQSTPLHDRATAPLGATVAAAAGAAGAVATGAHAARPESTFNPDPSAKELRRASSPVTLLPPLPKSRAGSQDPPTGLSRSKSIGEMGERALASSGSVTNGGGKNGSTPPEMRRGASMRRKPVPSLGAELRGEIERHRSGGKKGAAKGMVREDSGSGGSSEEGHRKSYQLVPDLPLRQE